MRKQSKDQRFVRGYLRYSQPSPWNWWPFCPANGVSRELSRRDYKESWFKTWTDEGSLRRFSTSLWSCESMYSRQLSCSRIHINKREIALLLLLYCTDFNRAIIVPVLYLCSFEQFIKPYLTGIGRGRLSILSIALQTAKYFLHPKDTKSVLHLKTGKDLW